MSAKCDCGGGCKNALCSCRKRGDSCHDSCGCDPAKCTNRRAPESSGGIALGSITLVPATGSGAASATKPSAPPRAQCECRSMCMTVRCSCRKVGGKCDPLHCGCSPEKCKNRDDEAPAPVSPLPSAASASSSKPSPPPSSTGCMSWFSCFDWSCFEDSARPTSGHARIAVHRIDRIGGTSEIHFLESKLKDFIRCPDVHAKFGDTLQRKSKHTMVLRSQAGRDNPFEVDHIFECQCASHAILQTPEWLPLWSSNAGILGALRESADGGGGKTQSVGRAFERFPVLAKTAREIYSIHNNLGANGAPLDDAFNMSMLQQSLNATKGSAFKSFLESRWGGVDGGDASAFEGLRHHFRHSNARLVHGILSDDDEADALAKTIHVQLQRQVRDPYIDAVNEVAQRYSRPEAAMFSGLADKLETMFDEFEQVSLEHD